MILQGEDMKEKLIELLKKNLFDDYDFEDLAEELIANGVTVQKKGEWDIRIDDYDCEYMVCSVCDTDFFDGENDTVDYKPNFCPVCGADMRGE